MKNRTAKPILITLFVIGAILCTVLPSFSQTPLKQPARDAIAEKINAIIDEEVQKTDLTGATIAVYYKGAPLISRGIGYADEPKGIKVNEHTGFLIGSITKLFTAMAVMKLVEEGVLSLDDSIFKYLPDYHPKLLPGVKKDNRIRDLLTHHSGIPSWWLKDYYYIKTPSLEPLRALPKALSDDYLVGNRREVHAYSNAAYALAGLIVERASGLPYDIFIRTHFFKTLEMNDAHVFLPDGQNGIALSHEKHQSWIPNESYCIPAGSFIVSATDMNQFMEMIIDTWHGDEDDIIDPITLRQMTAYQHTNVKYDHTDFMGLGIFIEQNQGFIQIGHGGDLIAFHSDLQFLPDLGVGVFISTNGYESSSFSRMTTSLILDALIGTESGQKGEEKQIKKLSHSINHPMAPSGKYVSRGNRITTINHECQTPFIMADSNSKKYPLEPLQENSWKIVGNSYTLHKSNLHDGYFVKKGSSSINLVPLKKYPKTPNWNRFLERTYSTQMPIRGKLNLKLIYDELEQVYYTHIYTTDKEINDPIDEWLIQHIVSDTLLQTQGKGRNSSLVTQFLNEDTVKFAGLTFTLEKNSDPKRIPDPSFNRPSNREEAIRRLKSLFSTPSQESFLNR